jgi:peptidoglycan/LPS O-acetylase OafA/YrhL
MDAASGLSSDDRQTQSSNPPRFEFVDALRGLAALYVVIYHMIVVPRLADVGPELDVPHWAYAVARRGDTAVTLFFIISAFSLCHTMQARRAERHEVHDFYIRRLFRIAPLFYVMIAVHMMRDWLDYHVLHGPGEIAINFLFIFNFFPGSVLGIVWASWTVGVEMIFYMIFPLLFARLGGIAAAIALCFAALLAGVAFNEVAAHLAITDAIRARFDQLSFFRHLPIFVFGMLCWLVFDRTIARQPRPPAVGAALILGSLWAYHAYLHGLLGFLFPDNYGDGAYWPAIIYGGLLLGLGILPSSIFVNSATLFCGRISYSIYLIHSPVVFYLTPVYRRIYASGSPLSAKFVICAAVTLGVVLPLAWASYRWIELPGMRLGKRVLAWRMQARLLNRPVTNSAPSI